MADRLAEIKANHLRYGVCLPGCRECWLIARIEVLEAANRELVQVIGTEYDRAAEEIADGLLKRATVDDCIRWARDPASLVADAAAAIRNLKESPDGEK
jgi:hypothetical protein